MGNSKDFLNEILRHGPSQSTMIMVLSKMKDEGRTHEVIQGCIKGLDIYPEDMGLKQLLAESYVEAGFIGLADSELCALEARMASMASIYKLHTRILAGQKRFNEAVESLKRYLAIQPNDTEAQTLMTEIAPIPEATTAKEIPAAGSAAPEPDLTDTKPPTESASEMPETETEEPLVDLATPTLAELYYNQGQILEAVSVYEKVVKDNPADGDSRDRLATLKAQLAEQPAALSGKEGIRLKTENTIAILENWRSRIREGSNA